jgi:hypothetical protein
MKEIKVRSRRTQSPIVKLYSVQEPSYAARSGVFKKYNCQHVDTCDCKEGADKSLNYGKGLEVIDVKKKWDNIKENGKSETVSFDGLYEN